MQEITMARYRHNDTTFTHRLCTEDDIVRVYAGEDYTIPVLLFTATCEVLAPDGKILGRMQMYVSEHNYSFWSWVPHIGQPQAKFTTSDIYKAEVEAAKLILSETGNAVC